MEKISINFPEILKTGIANIRIKSTWEGILVSRQSCRAWQKGDIFQEKTKKVIPEQGNLTKWYEPPGILAARSMKHPEFWRRGV